MVTLVIKNLECYAKKVIEIFSHRHSFKKDYSGSRVKRGIGKELGMTGPFKDKVNDTD